MTTRGRGRVSGVPVEMTFAQVWTFRDGEPARMVLYPRHRQGPPRRRPRPVRVIAGEFKGRRLHPPRGTRTRPTADRVREALFSMLGDVSGARVLDLYAGSGALGIEALSRGAESAVFVERDERALAALRRNLDAVGARRRGQAAGRHCVSWRVLRAHTTSSSATPHMMMRRAWPPRCPRRCRRSLERTHAS